MPWTVDFIKGSGIKRGTWLQGTGSASFDTAASLRSSGGLMPAGICQAMRSTAAVEAGMALTKTEHKDVDHDESGDQQDRCYLCEQGKGFVTGKGSEDIADDQHKTGDQEDPADDKKGNKHDCCF